MSESTQLAVHSAPKASDQLATFLGIEKGMMLDTLKAQCFTGKRPDEVSDAQLAAFVSTANVLKVNPLIPGMLYAYPSKNGGIVPVLGPDGTFKKLDEHIAEGKLEGYECIVYPEDVTQKPTHATATIHRKNAKPATYTALFSEWAMAQSPVWASKPRHMLWTRAIKQAARQVIHGLPMDAEEYAMSEIHNVTGSAEQPAATPERPAPKPRSPKGAAVVKENAPKVVDAVVEMVAETPPATTQAPAPEPAPAPAKVESFADAAAAVEPAKPASPANPEPVSQKAMLADGEALEVTASVESFKTEIAKRNGADWPYVKARVTSPQFAGDVSMTDGGLADGKPIAAWQLDRPVVLKLRGKRYRSGALITLVESITEAAPVTVSEPDEF